MNLVAIDLGKFKSVACLYRSDDDVTFRTIETGPQAVHDLLVEWGPERLDVEVGTVTGWVHDIAVGLGIEVKTTAHRMAHENSATKCVIRMGRPMALRQPSAKRGGS